MRIRAIVLLLEQLQSGTRSSWHGSCTSVSRSLGTSLEQAASQFQVPSSQQQHDPTIISPPSTHTTVRWRHTLTKPLIVQAIDVLQLQSQIHAATSLEELAIPVINHAEILTPDQVTQGLTRLAHLRWHTSHHQLLEQRTLPQVLLARLVKRYSELLPHLTHDQLSKGLYLISKSYQRLSTHTSQVKKYLAEPLTTAQQHVLSLLTGTGSPLNLPHAAACIWSLVALSKAGVQLGRQDQLLTAVYNLVKPLQNAPEQLAAQAGWKGLAQLTGAAEQVCLAAADQEQEFSAHRQLVTALADAITYQLQDHLQASNLSAGALLPRCHYRYRTIKGIKETTQPITPRTSKYLRDTSPRIIPQDFTPTTLIPTLRGLHLLHQKTGINHLPADLTQAATAHLLASMPPFTTEPKDTSRRSKAALLGLPEPLPIPQPVVRPLPVPYVQQLVRLLAEENVRNASQLSTRLLMELTRARTQRKQPLHIDNVLYGLHLAMSLRLAPDHVSVTALIHSLGQALNVDTTELQAQGAAAAAVGTGTAVVAAPQVPTRKGHAVALRPGQMVAVFSTLSGLGCANTPSHRIFLATLQQVERVPSSQWKCTGQVGLLLTAIASVSDTPASDPVLKDAVDAAKRCVFVQLQEYISHHISAYGGKDAVRCAAALSLWEGHNQDVLGLTALKATSLPLKDLPMFNSIMEEYVQVLPRVLRRKLEVALRKADDKHKLLPFLSK